MRKLLNTLYINNPDYFLMIENKNVVVNDNEKTIIKIPIINLESIISTSYKGATMRLMHECVNNGITLSFISEHGKYLGTFIGESKGNILLRKEQYRISDNEKRNIEYVKLFIAAKIHNSKWILERAIRDHLDKLNYEKIKNASLKLTELVNTVINSSEINEIRITEGVAAQYYFSEFNQLILNSKDLFYFKNRNRRPPLDALNALLSFAYTLLAHDCRGALESVGLDAYCGFMHTDRAGRCSLALDLMEELRPVIADRFVLKVINLKKFSKDDFEFMKSGAVILNETGRKKFLTSWQEQKQELLTHPFLNEKIEWGLVPYTQALLLARTIRGDLEKYPPFFWK